MYIGIVFVMYNQIETGYNPITWLTFSSYFVIEEVGFSWVLYLNAAFKMSPKRQL